MDGILYILTKQQPEPRELPSVPGSELSLEGPREASYDDIPAGISLLWPDLRFLSVLKAEPAPSPEASVSFNRFAERIAAEYDGIAWREGEDPHKVFSDPITLPSVNEFTPLTGFAVCFAADPGLRSLRRRAVALFEKRLPYLTPEKYGEGFPPDREYDGAQNYLDFLDGCDYPVIYPRLPVTNLFFAEGGRGTGCGSVSFFLPSSLWEIPSWSHALCGLLCDLSVLYGAFFANVSDARRPGDSSVWNGVPFELGHAAVFGPAYSGLIGGRENGKEIADGYLFFREPDGPDVPGNLIEAPSSGLFRKKRKAEIPEGCLPAGRKE